MGKKLPWYAYAGIGVAVTTLALFIWGKYGKKAEDKKTDPAAPVKPPVEADKKPMLAGGVFRTN